MAYIYEYHRGKLDRRLGAVYDEIVEAVKKRKTSVNLNLTDPDDLSAAYNAVYYDHPELFWMDCRISAQMTRSFRGACIALMLRNLYSDGEIRTIQAALEAAASKVRGADDEQTENNIVELIVKNTVYEIDITYNQNAASALYFKKAQCSGIARAVKYLCDCNNIKCIFVDGSIKLSGGGPHAWNIIEIKGKNYHLDATSILGSNPTRSFVDKRYFNRTDDQMLASHAWNRPHFPACTQTWGEEESRDSRQTQPVRPRPYGGQNTAQPRPYGSQNTAQPQPRPYGRPAPQPQPQPAQRQTAPQAGGNLKRLNSLYELRGFIEEELKKGKREMQFALGVGSSAEEKMKMAMNAVKMVMQKLAMGGQISVEICGETLTVKIE